ncbi:MAG: hypothetical protein JW846_00640 [Dehalococcoidia bacterium]|nr:hypothetical protein [Dehalococcoidia bacterium]
MNPIERIVRQIGHLSLHKWMAVLGLALGAWATALNLLYVNEYLLLLGPVLIMASVFALRQRSSTVPAADSFSSLNVRGAMLAQAAVWLLLGIMVLLAHSHAVERPLAFFVVAAVVVVLLALRAFEAPSRAGTAAYLLQLLVFSLVLSASVFYLTSGLPGSDAWGHQLLIDAIGQRSHLPPTSEYFGYRFYPLMHMAVAMAQKVLAVSSKTALFLAVSVPLTLSTLAVYAFARRYLSHSAARLVPLLLVASSYFMQWGTQVIPTSMGLAIFVVLMMLLTRTDRWTTADFTLWLLLIAALVACHEVSVFIFFSAVAFMLAFHMLLRHVPFGFATASSTRVQKTALFISVMLVVTYWSTVPYAVDGTPFFDVVLTTLRNSIQGQAGFLARTEVVLTAGEWMQALLTVGGFAAFYGLVAVGFFVWLRPEHRTPRKLALADTVIALTAIALVFPLFGLRNILPHRWFAFIWVLAALPASQGLLALWERVPHGRLKTAGVAACVGILAFFMVTAPIANTDSPVYARSFTQRMCFYDSELQAASWAVNHASAPLAADLQFGIRILRDHSGAVDVSTNVMDEDALLSRSYVWRSTTLEQPVQSQSGVMFAPGPGHVLRLESAQAVVYADGTCEVFVPARELPEGNSSDAA